MMLQMQQQQILTHQQLRASLAQQRVTSDANQQQSSMAQMQQTVQALQAQQRAPFVNNVSGMGNMHDILSTLGGAGGLLSGASMSPALSPPSPPPSQMPSKKKRRKSGDSRQPKSKRVKRVDSDDGSPPGKNFRCTHPGCDANLKTRFSLNRHMKRHTGKRPYVCSWAGCNKSFAEKHTLKRHVQAHNGLRPHICLDCNAAFADLCNLHVHMRANGHKRRTTRHATEEELAEMAKSNDEGSEDGKG